MVQIVIPKVDIKVVGCTVVLLEYAMASINPVAVATVFNGKSEALPRYNPMASGPFCIVALGKIIFGVGETCELPK